MDAACYPLLFNDKRRAWLIAFNLPERGLTPDKPCYVPLWAITNFAAVEPVTGEVMYLGACRIGYGVVSLADEICAALPDLIASRLLEAERIAALERKALRKAIENNPANVRAKEDRMLRARHTRRKGQQQ